MLPGEDLDTGAASLRGLFVTQEIGGGTTYPSARTHRQTRQRIPGLNQSRTFRHHNRL